MYVFLFNCICTMLMAAVTYVFNKGYLEPVMFYATSKALKYSCLHAVMIHLFFQQGSKWSQHDQKLTVHKQTQQKHLP